MNNYISPSFFKKIRPLPASFFFIFVVSIQLTVNIQYNFLPMTGFELQTSEIGNNWATTTAHTYLLLCAKIFLDSHFKTSYSYPDQGPTFCYWKGIPTYWVNLLLQMMKVFTSVGLRTRPEVPKLRKSFNCSIPPKKMPSIQTFLCQVSLKFWN